MDTKNTLSITEARKKIFEISEQVQAPENYFVLTEKGKPKMVVMSAEEFESLIETIEVLETFPNIKKDIEDARRDYESGDYWIYKEGKILKNKPNVKYLRDRLNKKGQKRLKKDTK